MIFRLKRQTSWSRGELLLRTFLGSIYFLPHVVCLFFLFLVAGFIGVLNGFCILFLGRIPEGFFLFIRNVQFWKLRLGARQLNLCDGYPEMGMGGRDEMLEFHYDYQEEYRRSRVLLRWIFAGFLMIPYAIMLSVFGMVVSFVHLLGFFTILFTGRLPESFANLMSGFLIWQIQIENYFQYYTEEKMPPFMPMTAGQLYKIEET